jgi:hypothetical protein
MKCFAIQGGIRAVQVKQTFGAMVLRYEEAWPVLQEGDHIWLKQ